jgi:hypothetical protein
MDCRCSPPLIYATISTSSPYTSWSLTGGNTCSSFNTQLGVNQLSSCGHGEAPEGTPWQGRPKIYLDLALIFRLFRFSLLMRFFLHFARILSYREIETIWKIEIQLTVPIRPKLITCSRRLSQSPAWVSPLCYLQREGIMCKHRATSRISHYQHSRCLRLIKSQTSTILESGIKFVIIVVSWKIKRKLNIPMNCSWPPLRLIA